MGMRRTFEPGLENELGGDCIEQRLGGFAVAAGLAQACFGVERSQAFVGQGDRQIEAAAKAFGDLATCVGLAVVEWRQNRKLCSWCQVATVISAATAALSVPEAVRAIRGPAAA